MNFEKKIKEYFYPFNVNNKLLFFLYLPTECTQLDILTTNLCIFKENFNSSLFFKFILLYPIESNYNFFLHNFEKNPLFPRENQIQIVSYLDGRGQILSYNLLRSMTLAFIKIRHQTIV